MIPDNYRIVEPDLCTLLDYTELLIKKDINCVSIGTIQSFNATNQTATIALNYVKWISGQITPQDTTGFSKVLPFTTESYPPLVSCPVVVLNGGGGYLSFPIAPGDTCLVLFCDREIDTWQQFGGTNAPGVARVHSLNDGVALIGIKNLLNAIANYSRLATVLQSNQVQVNGTSVLDLASGGDVVIRGSELSIGAPVDTPPPYSTSENRRVWVVTNVSNNVLTLEERYLGLTVPPSPATRTITVR